MGGAERERVHRGVGAVTDHVVTLGAGHPATHGALRLALRLEGDRIAWAEAQVGYLHRGAEKLFEVRDYRQIAMLANRHDWLSSFGSELGVALVVERMLGLHVPERAQWLRTLLAELTRVLHHLAFLGTFPQQVADRPTEDAGAYRAREEIQLRVEEATGGRMHEMYVRVGGVHEDVPAAWPDAVATTVAGLRPRIRALREMVEEDTGVRRATAGVGVLDPAEAIGYGASGPVARASSVPLDLRRDAPYDAYAQLEVPLVVRESGDAHARLAVLAEECEVSLDLVDQCLGRLARLGEGPVRARLPKVVRAPVGHAYVATENPPGMNGWFLVSRGEPTPHRLKLRTASFPHAALLGRLLEGHRVADIPAVLASLAIVVGDIDR